MENKPSIDKTIPQQLTELAETICNKYCRYPGQYGEDAIDRMYDEVCDGCPLGRIL